jgi:hypothetical protein
MVENKRDPLPEHFNTLEEAGEFWDTHSAADYWDEMEEVEPKEKDERYPNLSMICFCENWLDFGTLLVCMPCLAPQD